MRGIAEGTVGEGTLLGVEVDLGLPVHGSQQVLAVIAEPVVIFPSHAGFQAHVVLRGVPGDLGDSVVEGDCEVLLVFAEGGVGSIVRGIVDGPMVSEGHESRPAVLVYLDEASNSSSQAQESMVVGDGEGIPGSELEGVGNGTILGVVAPVVLVDVGVFPIDCEADVHVVIGQGEVGRDVRFGWMGFFLHEFAPIENVY